MSAPYLLIWVLKLGFASHMSALRRTASAGLTLDSCPNSVTNF